jgi:glycosyltransferase involved in cell wall biosynthesis
MTVRATRIKLCYVIDNLSFRGGERVFAQLATGLDPEEYNVTVACSPGGPFVETLEAAGVRVVPFNMRPYFNPVALARLTLFLRRERPDIVHGQGRGDPYARIAATLAGVPTAISTTAMIISRYWGSNPLRKLAYWLTDKVTDRLVDHWIVVNQESIEVLVRDHGVPREAITLIPNGIEVERYAPENTNPQHIRRELGLDDESPLIGGVGKLTWQKGFTYLLHAMPAVLREHPEAHLALAGEGELEDDLKQEAIRLNIADRCHFLGFRRDIPDILAALDVFVLPSLIEGMPMVLLEAMATGKPVVVTQIPGSVDVIDDGIDGLVAPPKDSTATAEHVSQLLADSSRVQQLGNNARRKISQGYTVQRMLERTQDRYHSLIAPRGYDACSRIS